MQQWVGQAATLLRAEHQLAGVVFGHRAGQLRAERDRFRRLRHPLQLGPGDFDCPISPYQYMPDVAGALAFMYNLTGTKRSAKITNLVLDAQVDRRDLHRPDHHWNSPAITQLNPQLHGRPPLHDDPSGLPGGRLGRELFALRLPAPHGRIGFQATTRWQWRRRYPGSAFCDLADPVPPGDPNPGYPAWTAGNPSVRTDRTTQPTMCLRRRATGPSPTSRPLTQSSTTIRLRRSSTRAGTPFSRRQSTTRPPREGDPVQGPDSEPDGRLHEPSAERLPGVVVQLSGDAVLAEPCRRPEPTTCSGPSGTSSFPSAKGQALGQFVAFLACAGQQKMALLGYSPLPPNLVQEDFNAIGRMNGGQEPPPVTAANCKNPYVDGQTPLPGEPHVTRTGPPPKNPIVVGSTGPGGTNGNTPGSEGTKSSSPTGPAGSNATKGGSGAGGSAKGSGGSKGADEGYSVGPGGGNKGVKAYLQTHKVVAGAGSTSFTRADELEGAATSAVGLTSPVVRITIWCLVVAAGILFPLFFLGRVGRRKRKAGSLASAASGAKGLA